MKDNPQSQKTNAAELTTTQSGEGRPASETLGMTPSQLRALLDELQQQVTSLRRELEALNLAAMY